MMTRRAWMTLAGLSALTSGCGGFAKTNRKLNFARALAALESSRTEAELVAQLRVPDGVEHFNPGDHNDPYALNRMSRESWAAGTVFVPPTLLDTLPLGTRMLLYTFYYRPQRSGALMVYVDESGHILGWSYHKALENVRVTAALSEL